MCICILKLHKKVTAVSLAQKLSLVNLFFCLILIVASYLLFKMRNKVSIKFLYLNNFPSPLLSATSDKQSVHIKN